MTPNQSSETPQTFEGWLYRTQIGGRFEDDLREAFDAGVASQQTETRRYGESYSEAQMAYMDTSNSLEELKARYEAVVEAAQAFKGAIDREEAEYGFPFSFELRAAHRAFVAALEPTP